MLAAFLISTLSTVIAGIVVAMIAASESRRAAARGTPSKLVAVGVIETGLARVRRLGSARWELAS